MIHSIWQLLLFLQAQRDRHVSDLKRNRPTWLHISAHPLVHQLCETGTFCPVSAHCTAQRSLLNPCISLPQPLHMSRCMELHCSLRAVVPSFILLHTNSGLPQNKNMGLILAQETECIQNSDLEVPTSPAFSLLAVFR